MSIEQERNRLAQTETLARLRRNMSTAEMLTVCLERSNDAYSHGIYCALIPSKHIDKVLDSLNWDLMHGEGLPGSVAYREDKNRKIDYLRYGNTDGVEPLVIDREFHGVRKEYLEISEEFRLFHRLYHDRNLDRYVKIDEGGDEQVVAVVEPKQVKIRLKEIRQFLAIKEMHLSIQFYCREDSKYTLEELGLVQDPAVQRDNLYCWSLRYGEFPGYRRTYSRLYGKRMIEPLSKAESEFSGFAKEQKKKYIDFIIGVDDNGAEIEHTCAAPDSLYLTPVSFRKQVLDKYYQQSSKYRVSDNILGCGTLWSIQIDNHHDNKVCVWLGDLGNLPYKEQLHWKAHNFVSDTGVSETYFRRQIDAQFTDSDRPEHVFQKLYSELEKVCQEQLGWPLLLPLQPDDTYHLQNIRVPANDEQRDFDELVLGLTKILVDSLNEEQLKMLIPHEQRKSVKGSISRLGRVIS